MLSQDSFDSVHSATPSVAEEDIEDEDDAMELLGKTFGAFLLTHNPGHLFTRVKMHRQL